MRMPTPTGTSVRLIVNITCCLATSTVPKSSERGDCWCGGAECNSVYVRQSNLEGGAGPEITSTAIPWQQGGQLSVSENTCLRLSLPFDSDKSRAAGTEFAGDRLIRRRMR